MQLSVGQAMEVQHCLARGEWSPEDLKRACQGDLLSREVLDVLRGDAQIVPINRTIDGSCDCDPEVGIKHTNPEIVRHTSFGVYQWSDLSFEIFKPTFTPYPSRRVEKRERDFAKFNVEEQLPQYLVGKMLGNKNLRDYLLRYPHLIPQEWHTATWSLSGPYDQLLFWGTILRVGYDSSRKLVIPGIRHNGQRWLASDCDLEQAAERHDYSYAVIVSSTA